MTTDSTRATRPVRVAFLNCFDATLFFADVQLSADDGTRLAAVLGWLQDAGMLLLPVPQGASDCSDLASVLAILRAAFGDQVVEAFLAAGRDLPRANRPAPTAVMPIWPFEPEGGGSRDVLVGSGRVWGADVLLEALRVDDPDSAEPMPAVRSRFDRWVGAAGGQRTRAVIHPPGEDGCYVLAGMAAPV
jgi:hypothetical protein